MLLTKVVHSLPVSPAKPAGLCRSSHSPFFRDIPPTMNYTALSGTRCRLSIVTPPPPPYIQCSFSKKYRSSRYMERTSGNTGSFPGDLERAPDDSERAPGDSERAPGDSERAPGDSERAPDDSERAPGDSERAPDDSERAPDDSERAPDDWEWSVNHRQ
jgi:hypothetical protein